MERITPNYDRLHNLRCYDLLVNNIPGGLIISELLKELLPRFRVEYQHNLIMYAAKYDNLLNKGSKEIMFIEAFLANVMVLAYQ